MLLALVRTTVEQGMENFQNVLFFRQLCNEPHSSYNIHGYETIEFLCALRLTPFSSYLFVLACTK